MISIPAVNDRISGKGVQCVCYLMLYDADYTVKQFFEQIV